MTTNTIDAAVLFAQIGRQAFQIDQLEGLVRSLRGELASCKAAQEADDAAGNAERAVEELVEAAK